MAITFSQDASARCLHIDEAGDDAVVVTVVGGVAASRGIELWSDLEGALEQAAGRLVVVDLRAVTGFDLYTLDSLMRVGRAAARRHLDICSVMSPSGPLAQYARSCALDELLPIYESVGAALSLGGSDAW